MSYVTADEIKQALAEAADEFGDDHDDAFDAVGAAATAAVERYTDRVWTVTASQPRTFSPNGPYRSVLSIDEAQSVTAVKVYDAFPSAVATTLTLGTDYALAGRNCGPAGIVSGGVGAIETIFRTSGYWPFLDTAGTVEVTGTWGASQQPPDDVKRATLILACRLFQRRDAVLGLSGGGVDGLAVRLSRTDPDVLFLLQSRRRWSIG